MSYVTDLLLPERARLLHIGPMKTGTTSLQQALAAQRRNLLEHGVRYPGTAINHRRPIGAFMGSPVTHRNKRGTVGRGGGFDPENPAIPKYDEWVSLLNEIDNDQFRRIIVSHESVAQASGATTQEFREALGTRTHVVITIRHLAFVLPSFWVQLLKSAHTNALDEWVTRAFTDDQDRALPAWISRNLNFTELIERWATKFGYNNLTVVIADRQQPQVLTNAFESLLGLPIGLLSNHSASGFTTNRSLRLREAELLRQINEISKVNAVRWKNYSTMVRHGVVRRLLENYVPESDEPKVKLPDWAIDRCRELGKANAEFLESSGIRVVGDPSSLHAPVPARPPADEPITDIPLDVAVEAVAGVMSSALGRKAFFSRSVKPMNVQTGEDPLPSFLAESYGVRDLAAAVGIQLGRRLRPSKQDRGPGT